MKNLLFTALLFLTLTGLTVAQQKYEATNKSNLLADSSTSETQIISMSRSNLLSSLNPDQWNYIAITKSSDLIGKMYINGVLISTGSWENQDYWYSSLFIGASYYTSWGSYYKGYLDEFRMSNVVRSADEIARYYSSNQPFTKDNNTIGLWHFDEVSGSTFSNSVAGTNSGSLYNGVEFLPGKFGNALYFNGNETRGDCNIDIPEYNITFELWFKYSEVQNSTIYNAYGLYNSHLDLYIKQPDPVPTPLQASNITFRDILSNQLTFNWVDGNCAKRAVFMRQDSVATAAPINNTTYAANTDFGSGTQIGSSGWHCVFNGTTHASGVVITNLQPNTGYRVMVCEYSGDPGSEQYNTTVVNGNPINQNTSAGNFFANGRVAYYPFNGNANDESGNGNNGTPSGATLTTDRNGNANSAYQFNGTDNYIRLLNPLPIDNTFTLSFWAYNEMTGSNYGNIISDGGSQDGGNDFLLNLSGDRIGIRADKGGNSLNYEYNSPSGMSNLTISNKWVHVVWVMNPNQSLIYLDGSKIAEINESGTNTGYHDLNSFIGARQVWGSPDTFFKGKIDDIDIYNRALTPNEVLALYQGDVSFNIELSSNPTTTGTTTGGGTYTKGSQATVTAIPAKDCSFVVWTENSKIVSTNATYTFTVAENRNLVANFALPQANIETFSNPNNGGNTYGEGIYERGSQVTVSVSAKPGYSFSNWTVNGNIVSNSPQYTFTANENQNLTANFTLQQYTVTTSSSPAMAGTTSGGGTFDHGVPSTVAAYTNNGWTFNHWSENGVTVSTNPIYSFMVDSTRALVANFLSTVGTEESIYAGIQVYPNPVSDKLHITLKRASGLSISEIIFTNSSGAVVYQMESNGTDENFIIDLLNFKPGMYNLLISNKENQRVAAFKIAVIH